MTDEIRAASSRFPPIHDAAGQAQLAAAAAAANTEGRYNGVPHLRVTAVRADRPRRGTRVGDTFEIRGRGERVVIPDGGSFDIALMCSIIPVVREKQTATDARSWIHRKSYLLGPDPTEQIVMQMELIGAEE